jgi:hypothetical protein
MPNILEILKKCFYDSVARFAYAECSVIRYRGGTVVLYPLAKYQPEVKPPYGKRVHVVIIAEGVASNHINLYET